MVTEVQKLSGVEQQLSPEDLQIVDGEPQLLTQAPAPLVEVGEPDKRMGPLPVSVVPTAGVPSPVPFVTTPAGAVAVGLPVAKWDKYTGSDQEWKELLRWDIPAGYMGDLHHMAVLSDNDTKTRYRIWLASQDQQWPTDRALTTPFELPWRETKIPGDTSVYIEVRTTDGTEINVEGTLSGTLRLPE